MKTKILIPKKFTSPPQNLETWPQVWFQADALNKSHKAFFDRT